MIFFCQAVSSLSKSFVDWCGKDHNNQGIGSEELTKEHANQGMRFDKAACVGWTSAILNGFNNRYNNITKDLLAAYSGGKTVHYDDVKGTGNTEIAKAFGTYWQSVADQK